jgi:hypothetical protein
MMGISGANGTSFANLKIVVGSSCMNGQIIGFHPRASTQSMFFQKNPYKTITWPEHGSQASKLGT